MTTPAGQTFAMLVGVTATLFVLWHTWHYDRFRCFVPSRKDWFKSLMCWILLFSGLCFSAWSSTEMAVLYREYYAYIEYVTIVAPWQLWTSHDQIVARRGYYILAGGWTLLHSVHLEEFLYWGYLITSIRTPGGPSRTWTQSSFFKVWVVGTLCTAAIIYGALNIETTNIDMMKVYLFVTGSCISLCFAAASVVLVWVFPGFIRTVRRQGAPLDVVERLLFFAELNEIRTVFRIVYGVSFLILAADGLTAAKRVNTSAFWSDVLYLGGMLAVFASSCMSVIILLPRNMSTESLPTHAAGAHAMMAFQRPGRGGSAGAAPLAQRHYFELGDRLNVDRDALAGNAAAWEMTSRTHAAFGGYDPDFKDGTGGGGEAERPFAQAADKTRHARYSEMPNLPAVVQKFKSPFETAPARSSATAPRVFVTSETVIEEGRS